MIYTTIMGFIKVVIKGSPRLLVLNSLVWILFGMICGAVGLGNQGFFNIFTIIFLGWAAVEIALALIRYSAWKKEGLRQSLPDGTTFLRVDHILQVERRTRALLNVRETTTTFHKQLVTLAPPATGSQQISVRCTTCQEELGFRVASLETRKAKRLRAALIAALCLLLGLGVSILFSDAFQVQPVADWVGWVRTSALILLFCGVLATAYTLNYNGIVLVTNPRHRHRVHQPEKADFEQFRQQVSSTMGGPLMQRAPYQQGWR